uniref:DDE_Tnp_1_7 domain-containing protein n=1 Tax=Heterorhabditis bacteriophora TaxID=37862 RepID=A0A1I7XSW3_HETBA
MMPESSSIFVPASEDHLPSGPTPPESPYLDRSEMIKRFSGLPKMAEAVSKYHYKLLKYLRRIIYIYIPLYNLFWVVLFHLDDGKLLDAVMNCLSVDVTQMAAKVESLKKWTIGTFKNSKQQLLEHMGKILARFGCNLLIDEAPSVGTKSYAGDVSPT